MPTPTYTPLANSTLSSAASTVTFSSIPNTYRDLILVISALGSTTVSGRIRFNNDSGSNYHYLTIAGNGSTASRGYNQGLTSIYASDIATASTTNRLNLTVDILDSSATDKHKIVLSKSASSAVAVEGVVARWASTSAVTSIAIFPSTGQWASGSTFALYGIAS